MILKQECKNLGVKVSDLSEILGVPVRTLQDWAKSESKQKLIKHILSSISPVKPKSSVPEFNQRYWVPNLNCSFGGTGIEFIRYVWTNCPEDNYNLANGLVCFSKQEAKDMTQRLLKANCA